jgi:phage baseplate assembly protein V
VVNFWIEVRAVVREEIRRVRAKALGMIRRGVLRSSKLTGAVQTAQVATLSDTVRDEVELFEPYGFTSAPPAGSEGVVLHPGGDTSHPIGLAFGSRSVRPTDLQSGDVVVYSSSGARIHIHGATGAIEIIAAEGQVVALGGEGGEPVAREGDPVLPSETLVTWAGAVQTALNGLGAPVSPLFNAGAQTDFASISAGGTGATST